VSTSEIVIVDYEATCAAAIGLHALRDALMEQRSGLRPNNLAESNLATWVGKVPELDNALWPDNLQNWQSRNNALIAMGLNQGHFMDSVAQLKVRFDDDRIGVVMGSSTSSIDRAEAAYRELTDDGHLRPDFLQEKVLNPHAPGLFVAELCQLEGPAFTINTACSSSAKVFATAARWLRMGLVDAVIVGGADSLCLSVLHGFHSLQLVSEQACKPFDEHRDGINLGEATGFAILTREEDAREHAGIKLSGFGESSDAHHMSHPHPKGFGARLAIEQALTEAKLTAKDIGYINLHGTASRANDAIEGNLIGSIFPSHTLASSTKAWMGHTLGAAGILEAIVAMDSLNTGLIPGTLNMQSIDPRIKINMSNENAERQVEHVMSNSFGFGGNNCCVIFSQP